MEGREGGCRNKIKCLAIITLFYLLLIFYFDTFRVVLCGGQQNETKTNYVFQMRILGGGEEKGGRNEMKFSIVSTLHFKDKRLL